MYGPEIIWYVAGKAENERTVIVIYFCILSVNTGDH